MIKFCDPCSESRGQLKNHEIGSASEIQDGRRRHLASRFWPPFRCYLFDLYQIVHTDAFNAAAYFKIRKPEIQAEIQDVGSGHLGFLETQ